MIKKIILSLIASILIFIIWGWFSIWRSPAQFTDYESCGFDSLILSMDEYWKIIDQHPRPYIISIDNENAGSLFFFGSTHTTDPKHPEIKMIRDTWDNFQPTLALVEGRLGFLMPGFMHPIKTYGEMGAVNKLAKRSGVKTLSWEMPIENEITQVLDKFSAEQVSLFYILRPYFSNFRHGKPEDPDQFIQQFLSRGSVTGLDGIIGSVEDIDKVWQRDFASLPDWRDTSDEYGLPGYLQEVSYESNMVRNKHLACLITHFVNLGERVFAIGGSSHPVCIDRAVTSAIEK
ncbi:MAG: hypothetical protein AAF502_25315 [Bacteroidota bacterium]